MNLEISIGICLMTIVSFSHSLASPIFKTQKRFSNSLVERYMPYFMS